MRTEVQACSSVLRKLLQDDRALIKQVATGFKDLLLNDGWVRRCNEASGDDQVRSALVVRVARATLLAFSGQYFYRIVVQFEGEPHDFVVAQGLAVEEAKQLYQKFHDADKCCLGPYFGKRIRRMSAGVQELMDEAGSMSS